MKQLSKCKLIEQKCYEDIIYQQELCSRLEHPFIAPLLFSFQHKEYLYMVNDLMSGGDLRYWYIQKKFLLKKSANLLLPVLF